MKASLAAILLVLAAQSAFAATPEPVRRIPVVVQPYYAVARTPEDRPKVEVGRAFDHALASTSAHRNRRGARLDRGQSRARSRR